MKESKNILITGGTGFIGNYLCRKLLTDGHFLSIITRSPEKYTEKQAENRKFIGWDDDLASVMNSTDIVINLVGENLFGKRWTESVKKKIYNSRIESTRNLVAAMKASESKPELFISASGVGIYGDRGDEVLDESSSLGDDFLANVCKDWEKAAMKAAEIGVRVVTPRFGVVLQTDGGMLEIMKLPFSLFIGGPIGSGKQYLPWIHMQDLCNILLYCFDNPELRGPCNACSPEPVTMNEFSKKLGKVMNRPSFFRVPEFVLKTVLGEAAQPAISSLLVQPKVLQISGFQFEFEDVEEALADLF